MPNLSESLLTRFHTDSGVIMYNVCTASQGVHGDPIQDGGGSDRSRKRQEKLSRRILLRRRQPRQRPQKSCHQIASNIWKSPDMSTQPRRFP